MKRRDCISLNPFEHDTLARLYLERLIATDRYMHRPRDLKSLTATFNALTGRDDTPEDVLHYMQTKRRRAGQWPTFDGNHRRLSIVLGNLIDDEFVEVLKLLYTEFKRGCEAFIQDPALGRLLERRFAEITGVQAPAFVLATAMMELRKDGRLPRIERSGPNFNDFDEADGKAD